MKLIVKELIEIFFMINILQNLRSGWNAIGELKMARPFEKVRDFYFYSQAKLILNGIMGARLILLLLIISFVLALIVDAVTILAFITFKTNVIAEPTIGMYEAETHRLSIFASEEMRKVYFRLMANDRFQYYTEFAKLYGFYERPKPIRYHEFAHFPSLWDVFEDRGLVAVSREKLRRTLIVFKPFAYIDGSLPEPWWDVHLQDLALKRELRAIRDTLEQSDDPDELKTIKIITAEWRHSIDARRWVLPKYELAAIVVSVLIFHLVDDAMFVPEYVVWEKSMELLPKIYKYMYSRRR